MIILIILPTTMLPSSSGDAVVVVMIVGLFAGLFTVAEYASESPSLIEFRDAPPYNRVRFIAIFCSVYLLSLLFQGNPGNSMLVDVLGELAMRIGYSVDFPYSPVRLMLVMMPDDTPPATLDALRTAAGLCYFVSLLSLAVFVSMLRSRLWPRRTQTFNFWVNLPTFDPTVGGDVVDRLNRDSAVNLILGFLLPFMIPAILKLTAMFIGTFKFEDPQTLIWMVVIWAFLPSSLLMRGIALSRVAGLIHVQRKKAYAAAAAEGMLPV